MKTSFCLAALGALVLTGCGNNSSNSPQPTNAAPAAQTPAAGGNYGSSLANAQNQAVSVLGQTSIQEAIRNFNISEGRYPKNLDELVSTRFLSQIPPAPRGKKYDYNAATGEIKLADQ